MNEEILKLLKHVIEEMVKNLISDAMKNKFDNLPINVNAQNNNNVSRPYTMFHPMNSLKEQAEKHRREKDEAFKKNNHGNHKIGEKRPKHLESQTQLTYDNYERNNSLLKELEDARKFRSHPKL